MASRRPSDAGSEPPFRLALRVESKQFLKYFSKALSTGFILSTCVNLLRTKLILLLALKSFLDRPRCVTYLGFLVSITLFFFYFFCECLIVNCCFYFVFIATHFLCAFVDLNWNRSVCDLRLLVLLFLILLIFFYFNFFEWKF